MSIPRLDTMHLRNKAYVGLVVSFLLLIALCFLPASGLIKAQAQDPSHPQATPLPKDVDPNDPAVPVWMRPAGTKPAATPQPKAAENLPKGQQTISPGVGDAGGDLGEVKKRG